jgi:hypothetical protein
MMNIINRTPAFLQRLLASRRESRPGKLLRLPATVPDYDRAFDHATRDLLARTTRIERERTEARALFPVLESSPPERRKLLLRNSACYQTWGMLALLLEQSRTTDFHDPIRITHLAELALVLADQLRQELYGEANLEDMRARAWSYIGNARRLQFDMAGAEKAFENAFQHLRRGTGDPIERALLLSLKASLCKVQEKKSQAIQLIRRAIHLFRTAGESHNAEKCLVQLAGVHLNEDEVLRDEIPREPWRPKNLQGQGVALQHHGLGEHPQPLDTHSSSYAGCTSYRGESSRLE